jgi:hypothetical protein
VVSFTPCLFMPGGRAPGIDWIGCCVDLRVGLDAIEKKKSLASAGSRISDSSVAHPIA